MKRIIALALVLLMVLTMAACGKSEAAIAVDAQIEAIGEVTKLSGRTIELAEEAVAQLSEEDVASLENLALLEKARSDYDYLFVKEVMDVIDGIGEIDYQSDAVIANARAQYDALSSSHKAQVENYAVLESAEARLPELKVEKVEELIASLADYSYDSSVNPFEEIGAAFTMLSEEQMQQLDNYSLYEEKLNEFNINYANELLSGVRLYYKLHRYGHIELYLNYKNGSDKVIKYFEMYPVFFNAVGDKLEYKYYDRISCQDTGPHEKGYGRDSSLCWKFYSHDYSGASTYDVAAVAFEDNVTITYTDNSVVTIPADVMNLVFGQ